MHVKTLLECRAEAPDSVLSGAASFADPATVRALLSSRCNPGYLSEALIVNSRCCIQNFRWQDLPLSKSLVIL